MNGCSDCIDATTGMTTYEDPLRFFSHGPASGSQKPETRNTPPRYREKVIRHEAGHFLLAYLLGCPIQVLQS